MTTHELDDELTYYLPKKHGNANSVISQTQDQPRSNRARPSLPGTTRSLEAHDGFELASGHGKSPILGNSDTGSEFGSSANISSHSPYGGFEVPIEDRRSPSLLEPNFDNVSYTARARTPLTNYGGFHVPADFGRMIDAEPEAPRPLFSGPNSPAKPSFLSGHVPNEGHRNPSILAPYGDTQVVGHHEDAHEDTSDSQPMTPESFEAQNASPFEYDNSNTIATGNTEFDAHGPSREFENPSDAQQKLQSIMLGPKSGVDPQDSFNDAASNITRIGPPLRTRLGASEQIDAQPIAIPGSSKQIDNDGDQRASSPIGNTSSPSHESSIAPRTHPEEIPIPLKSPERSRRLSALEPPMKSPRRFPVAAPEIPAFRYRDHDFGQAIMPPIQKLAASGETHDPQMDESYFSQSSRPTEKATPFDDDPFMSPLNRNPVNISPSNSLRRPQREFSPRPSQQSFENIPQRIDTGKRHQISNSESLPLKTPEVYDPERDVHFAGSGKFQTPRPSVEIPISGTPSREQSPILRKTSSKSSLFQRARAMFEQKSAASTAARTLSISGPISMSGDDGDGRKIRRSLDSDRSPQYKTAAPRRSIDRRSPALYGSPGKEGSSIYNSENSYGIAASPPRTGSRGSSTSGSIPASSIFRVKPQRFSIDGGSRPRAASRDEQSSLLERTLSDSSSRTGIGGNQNHRMI